MKRILVYSSSAVLALIILYIALYVIFLDIFVDLWWFRSLEYEGYFWMRLLYRFFISGEVTLVFFLMFFLHFWIASGYLEANDVSQRRRL